MDSVTKEELNLIDTGTEYSSEVVTCNENGQGSWVAQTELGHKVYLNAPVTAGENIEYIVKTSTRTNNNYCVLTNPAPRTYSNNFQGSVPRTPVDAVNIMRAIVYGYTYPAEGKTVSLAQVLEEKLGASEETHKSLIASMFIACTKS